MLLVPLPLISQMTRFRRHKANVAFWCCCELVQVRGLVQEQADEANDLGETRFVLAAADGESTATLELLRDAGADVNAVTQRGHNALMSAAMNGHLEAVRALHRLGVRHAAKPGGASALMLAAWNGHTQVVEALVELGGDVNAAYGTGFTPLIWAASKGHADTATALVRLGAALEAETKAGLTAALVAAQNGHAATVAALHAVGADLRRSATDGLRAAALAAKNGHAEVLRELGRLGVLDADAADSVGHTALMRAARAGHLEAVQVTYGELEKC